MNPLAFLAPYRWLIYAVLAAALVTGGTVALHRYNDRLREQGRQEVREAMQTAALREHESKAREGLRRLEAQDENQRVQDRQIAAARADAERNRADADRVREQSAAAAREWSTRLADSPSREDVAAAAAAIAVCTDVRSRLDAAAAVVTAHADAARAAGLKCEADYDALKPLP